MRGGSQSCRGHDSGAIILEVEVEEIMLVVASLLSLKEDVVSVILNLRNPR